MSGPRSFGGSNRYDQDLFITAALSRQAVGGHCVSNQRKSRVDTMGPTPRVDPRVDPGVKGVEGEGAEGADVNANSGVEIGTGTEIKVGAEGDSESRE
jgi:hypothetical protein